MAKRDLKVGIVGAGIGGMMASIAIARAGGKVTVLEAAQQLGEIGAGIQMVRGISDLALSITNVNIDPERGKALDQIRCRQSHWQRSCAI